MSLALTARQGRGATSARWGWALRKRMPGFVRRSWRLAQAVLAKQPAVPALPPELFSGARLFADRTELLASLPKAQRALEVGTDRGDFARTILARAAPHRLEIIDIDFSRFDPALRADSRVTCHEGASAQTMEQLDAGAYDWVYIDAGHGFDDVLADARAARRLVKPGGMLVFNDFAHIDPLLGRYGVHRAVAQFVLESRWMIHAMAYEPSGLYDIALRAPAAEHGA